MMPSVLWSAPVPRATKYPYSSILLQSASPYFPVGMILPGLQVSIFISNNNNHGQTVSFSWILCHYCPLIEPNTLHCDNKPPQRYNGSFVPPENKRISSFFAQNKELSLLLVCVGRSRQTIAKTISVFVCSVGITKGIRTAFFLEPWLWNCVTSTTWAGFVSLQKVFIIHNNITEFNLNLIWTSV